jgi:hypothetical protein
MFLEQELKCRPTQRAPDGWDAARFLELFCAMAVFRFPAFFSPVAGSAHRWAANDHGVSS